MKIKNLVIAVAVASLSVGTTFAAQSVNSYQDKQFLSAAMHGNSYTFNQHAIGKSGLWMGAIGQIGVQANTSYILKPGTDVPLVVAMPVGSFSFSIPYLMTGIGYNHGPLSGQVELETHLTYKQDGAKQIKTDTADNFQLSLAEAYLTYDLGYGYFVKAGQFNSPFGNYNAMSFAMNGGDALRDSLIQGFEGGFAMNHFYGSVTAVMNEGADSADKNAARPHSFIVNGGYKAKSGINTYGVEAAYQSNWTASNVALWSLQGQFGVGQLMLKAGVLSPRYDADSGNFWIYDFAGDYQVSRRLTAGAYLDYADASYTTAGPDKSSYEYILGAKTEYALSSHFDIDAYIQNAIPFKEAKSDGDKTNTSVMTAVTMRF